MFLRKTVPDLGLITLHTVTVTPHLPLSYHPWLVTLASSQYYQDLVNACPLDPFSELKMRISKGSWYQPATYAAAVERGCLSF